MSSSLPKAGTIPCESIYSSGNKQGQTCTEVARYYSKGKEGNNIYYCGIHSDKSSRKELPKLNKQEKIQRQKEVDEKHELTILEEKQKRIEKKEKGIVITHKMRMMHNVIQKPGYRDYFPNFRHANHPGGIGCATLSPKSLFIVKHGQPGLPDAQNIENMHQSCKKYKWETREEFNKHRIAFYLSSFAYRHKTKQTCQEALGKLEEEKKSSKRKREEKEKEEDKIWEYFVWRDQDGKEYELDICASRQFYCNFYENYVSNLPEFLFMKKKLEEGENMRICGYDAFEINKDNYISLYLNPDQSFGHELLLWTLLNIEDSSKWPWRMFRTFSLPLESLKESTIPPCKLKWDEIRKLYTLDI